MYRIVIQHVSKKIAVPKTNLLRRWAKSALKKKADAGEITLRIVGIEEMTTLNSTYRQKKGPTNVLSFPFSLPEDIVLDVPILGDVVLCANIINEEAEVQGKSQEAHWAHLVIHGVFHLLGLDHQKEEDAVIMESLEIETLHNLGFGNPYETGEIL